MSGAAARTGNLEEINKNNIYRKKLGEGCLKNGPTRTSNRKMNINRMAEES